MIMRVIEGTFTAVLAYLVIKNAGGFSTAIGAIGDVYSQAVSALQGPRERASAYADNSIFGMYQGRVPYGERK